MKHLINRIDLIVLEFVKKINFSKKTQSLINKINKGEVFAPLAFILIFFCSTDKDLSFGIILYLVGSIFMVDRFVLLIKKKTRKKRPRMFLEGTQIEKNDNHYSFPSAHAANSMVAALLLIEIANFPFFIIFFSILAGLGRIVTYHHFLSDVLGGWIIGFSFGILFIFLLRIFSSYFF